MADFGGPDLEAFRAEAREWLEANFPKSLAKDVEAQTAGIMSPEAPKGDLATWKQRMGEKGWGVPTWPKQYGGGGLTPAEARVLASEMAKIGAVNPITGMGVGMFGPTLLEYGTEEQKQKYIPDIATGKVRWCQGFSEPGAGSDLASLQTKAEDKGDHWIVNGSKIWTSGGQYADMIFCLVRTEPDAPKHDGISYLLFSMKTPGIEVRPLKTMTGSAEFNEVFFTDVRVPKSAVVGGRGKGWFVANATLKHERGMLGDPNATEARLHALIELMKAESVDGQRLIDDPILRDRAMRLQARVMAMKFNGLRNLTSSLNGEPPGMAGLIVKLQGCELNHQIAALAIDALGELGVLYEDGPHLRAKGSWQWNYMFDLGLIIGGGTAQIQKNIISERGLGLPREPKLASA